MTKNSLPQFFFAGRVEHDRDTVSRPDEMKKIGGGNFSGQGADDPKKFVGRQNAIFSSYVAKNENWKSFLG